MRKDVRKGDMVGAGKTYRLGRIFGRDGRTMVLPVDHGLMLGRISGLEDPVAMTRSAIEAGCDGLLMSAGLVRATAEFFAERTSPARLLTVDTLFWDDQDAATAASSVVASIRTAARLGVDAVKLLMAWDFPAVQRTATAARIARVVEEADRWEIPVMVEPVTLRETSRERAAELTVDAARIATELGADILKVAYPGKPELLAALVAESRLPVVILGGPRVSTIADLVEVVDEALGAGASGIVIGRQVWQRPPAERAAVMRALVELVHGRVSAAAALEGLASVA
ncbi:fructose-bisphosphate aldolase [Acidothermus cellulolyticus 11B]|uniref:Fructose-bisphosphate aldolase n=2 Tax=Acidothermus cellulolyticus TaxID=28049 RepID=A0LST4_ACIC1|nr:fructose-bisphosphate aldolase [Acidothermus cellulolyticus 11B]